MTKSFLTLLLAIFLISVTSYANLTHDDFYSARSISNEIIERWSPDEYIYVGVGRSPALIMAILEAKGHQVVHFPISAAKNWDEEMITLHFDEFMPQEVLNSEKKLLFIDFVVSGSLFYVFGTLNNYFAPGHALHKRADFVALASLFNKGRHKKLKDENWINIEEHNWGPINEHSFYTKLYDSRYQDVSYYGTVFDPADFEVHYYGNDNQLEPNPMYLKLVEEVRSRMEETGPDTSATKRLFLRCQRLFDRNAS